jgi:hypothetical protein
LPAAVKTEEKFRNEKVAVTETVLQPAETEDVTGNLPSVTVYFQAGSLAVTPAGGKTAKLAVELGETRFDAVGARAIRNTSSSEIRYVRVNFLGAGAPQTWAMTGLSPNYKLILENQYARTYDIRIPAHTNEPQHTHRDRVVICLSGAVMKHLFPDGREEPSTLTTGETAYRPGTTHIGQNLGDTNLWVIAVEPK